MTEVERDGVSKLLEQERMTLKALKECFESGKIHHEYYQPGYDATTARITALLCALETD